MAVIEADESVEGAGGVIRRRSAPSTWRPSYMKAVFYVACFEVAAVAVMRAAQALAPGGLVARIGVWLHWPALWAARELEAVWLVAFFQLVLFSLPVYVLAWGWWRLTRDEPEDEVPRLSPEQILEHVEGVGRQRACGTPELCRARKGLS